MTSLSRLICSSDFIGAIIGALISGFFAVLLFYFGLKHEKKKDRIKRQIELYDHLDYLKIAISGIVDKLVEQVNFIDQFIEKLNEKNFLRKELTVTQNINSTCLRAIPLLEIKNAFALKQDLGSKTFQKFVDCADSLDNFSNNISTYFQLFGKEFIRIQNLYGDGISGIQNTIEEYKKFLIINNHDITKDPLLLYWVKILSDWNSMDDKNSKNIKTDPYITFARLVTPLKNELPKIDLGYNASLRYYIRQCSGAIEDFEHQQNEFTEMFSNLSKGYKKLNIKMTEIKNCL